MTKLFSSTDVNNVRQIEWDYAKVFAIFAMIFVHFLAFCTFSKIDYIQILLIAILMSLIVSYHPDITLQNMYLNQLLGNFIETVGQNIVSCFPFLNWFIIPAAGMLFGNDLKRCNDKDELYKLILRYTSITAVILLILGFITREGMFAITGGTVPEKLSYLHLSM